MNLDQTVLPPDSEGELLARADRIAGKSFAQLAAELEIEVPPDLTRSKGWVGQLVERALGATASSRAVPDFDTLGVELKTLPVDVRGAPCESTFVCTIDLTEIGDAEWEHSRAYKKLARVLWVVVQGDRDVPLGERRIGSSLLWSPSAEEQADLRFDWEELAGRIGRGQIDTITGHLGKYLQVRPKAANARARRRITDADGVRVDTLPRGFYLRPAFTARILREHFVLGR